MEIFPCEDVVSESHFFGGEKFVGGQCYFTLVHLFQLLDLLQGLLLVSVHVFFHGFLKFQLLGSDGEIAILSILQLADEMLSLHLLPLLELLAKDVDLMGQLFIEIMHVVLVLMILFLVFDHPLPLDGYYLMCVSLFVAPLDAKNVAFLAEAKQDVVELHCKQLTIFEYFETLASDYVVDRSYSLASV